MSLEWKVQIGMTYNFIHECVEATVCCRCLSF